jgi:integrase
MVLVMSRPWKHPKTGVYYFRKAVPDALRAALGRAEKKQSLQTKDPAEARLRFSVVAAEVEREWALLRAAPEDLTREQLHALAGRWYDWFVRLHADEVGANPDVWALPVDALRDLDTWGMDARDVSDDAERPSGVQRRIAAYLMDRGRVSDFLKHENLKLSERSLVGFLDIVEPEFSAAHYRLSRFAGGDYGPDERASKFPAWRPSSRPSPDTSALVEVPTGPGQESLTGLLAAWWREAQATGLSPKTHDSYRNAVQKFVAFLGHDNARRVCPENVVQFKDHRLKEINPRTGAPVSPKTVKDSDLAGLKAVLGWARRNHRLPANPADGITLRLGKAKRTRSSGFTDDEATQILQAALSLPRGNLTPKTHAAKRWVPWLCAYTGARVGEMAQLRREDLRQVGGQWVVTISPDAGTVKSGELREVPLHEHLVALGFPEFVEQSSSGHLFVQVRTAADVRGPLKGLTNRLADFVRKDVGITDSRVSPTHGWRHRFKSVARELGAADTVVDAIQGHSTGTVSSRYGEFTIKAKARVISMMPRIDVERERPAQDPLRLTSISEN